MIEALAHHMPQATVGGAALGLHLIAWLPDRSRRGTDQQTRRRPRNRVAHPPPPLRGERTAPSSAAPRLRTAPRARHPASRRTARRQHPRYNQAANAHPAQESTAGDRPQLNHRRPRASLAAPPSRLATLAPSRATTISASAAGGNGRKSVARSAVHCDRAPFLHFSQRLVAAPNRGRDTSGQAPTRRSRRSWDRPDQPLPARNHRVRPRDRVQVHPGDQVVSH